jgi:molybdopterin-biosynthesis enzyme MoeA-like protein
MRITVEAIGPTASDATADAIAQARFIEVSAPSNERA